MSIDFNESDVNEWDRLPPHLKDYYRILLNDGIKDTEEVSVEAPFILSPNLIEPAIKSRISALDRFSVTPETAKNERVIRGWKILQEFVEKHKLELQRRNLLLMTYGSLRYDDPLNMDFDILAFHRGEDNLRPRTNELTAELNGNWKDLGHEGRIHYLNLETVDEYVDALKERDTEYIKDRSDDIYWDLRMCSTLRSGYPLYDPDNKTFAAEQNHLSQNIKATPYLGATIITRLDQDLSRRHERRNLPPPEL